MVESSGQQVKSIRIDCFYDGKLKDWGLVQRVKIDDKDKLIYEIKNGDILVNRVNSIVYLGKCLLVDDLPEECIFESNMMRIIVNKDFISPEYTKTFLISQNGLSEMRKNAKHAVNQASINQQDVKAVEIDYPPLEEQQEIVRRVESLFAKADQIEASYQKLKAQLEQLPQALPAKAFRGELVAQLPAGWRCPRFAGADKASQSRVGERRENQKDERGCGCKDGSGRWNEIWKIAQFNFKVNIT